MLLVFIMQYIKLKIQKLEKLNSKKKGETFLISFVSAVSGFLTNSTLSIVYDIYIYICLLANESSRLHLISSMDVGYVVF